MNDSFENRRRETRPEILARRDLAAKRIIESFERDGLHLMARSVRLTAPLVRDLAVGPANSASGN